MASLPSEFTSPATVAAMTAAAAAGGGTDYKAVICFFLYGANDAHNTVMYLSTGNALSQENQAAYVAARPTQAIPEATVPTHLMGANRRLHPNLVNFYAQWNASKMAVVMNVGMLTKYYTRADWTAVPQVAPPRDLFAHNQQQDLWTTLPEGDNQIATYHGIFGRVMELMDPYYNPTSYNSLPAAYNYQGAAKTCTGYVKPANAAVTTGFTTADTISNVYGSTIVSGGYWGPHRTKVGWDNIIQEQLGASIGAGVISQASLAAPNGVALPALTATPAGRFSALSANKLAMQLQAVVRIIENRAAYFQRRQLFFVGLGGFDHHQNLRAQHDPLMTTVDDAIGATVLALADIGMTNNVVMFSASDFGRALPENGSGGVDHGWGAYHFVIGGPVVGGTYGTVPSIIMNGADDTDKGRLIPTTSVEKYMGTVIEWFGVPEAQIELALPNFNNFANPLFPTMFV